MAEYLSPFLLAQQLARTLNNRLASLDTDVYSRQEQKQLQLIRQLAADARLDARDYELSETRDEQLAKAKQGTGTLNQLRAHILQSSEYNVFSAVDVAEMTAKVDQIISRLE